MLIDTKGNSVFTKEFNGNTITIVVTPIGEAHLGKIKQIPKPHYDIPEDVRTGTFFVSSACVWNKSVKLDFTNKVNMYNFQNDKYAAEYAKDIIVEQLSEFIRLLVTKER